MSVPKKALEQQLEDQLKKEHEGDLGFMKNIEHVVVLMLENRGFDHFMGWLYGDKGDAEGDPAKINSVGLPNATNFWTGKPLRVFEGLSGLDLDQLSCAYDYAIPKAGRKVTGQGKAAPRPVRGASDPAVPRINPHEDFIHILEDMYYGTSEALTKDKLHADLDDAKKRDPLLKNKDAWRQPAMRGWAQNYCDGLGHHYGPGAVTPENVAKILQTYTPEQLPVLSFLARHYAVSDLWFCSVPSQTNTNRAFWCAGTSRGLVKNSYYEAYPKGSTVDTHSERLPLEALVNKTVCSGTRCLFDLLTEKGVSWKYYWESQWPEPPMVATAGHYFSLMFAQYRARETDSSNPAPPLCFPKMAQFWRDAQAGTLPSVSYIEPSFSGAPHWDFPARLIGNEFHPASDSACGEFYVRKIYEALASNVEKWPRTLLLITFDENGGTYDHFPPYPATPSGRDWGSNKDVGAKWATNWDATTGSQYGFKFDMYGVRVPTILVSPFIRPNTIFRSETATPYDHTSVISTIVKWVQMKKGNVKPEEVMLGDRVARAPTFDGVLQGPPAKDAKGWKGGMRIPDDPGLGIWPVRPGKEKEVALNYGEIFHLRYLGNKWVAPYNDPLYLGGPPQTQTGFATIGSYYPNISRRDAAFPFRLRAISGQAGAVRNGERAELIVNINQVDYRLVVPDKMADTNPYFEKFKEQAEERLRIQTYGLWHPWLAGDRVPGRGLYHGDQIFLFTDRYWWEPDRPPNVGTGLRGYDVYYKLYLDPYGPVGNQAELRAAEWDLWVIERASDEAPKVVLPELGSPSPGVPVPVVSGGPKPKPEIDQLLDLCDKWSAAERDAETQRAGLLERWTTFSAGTSFDLGSDEGKANKLMDGIQAAYYRAYTVPNDAQQNNKVAVDKLLAGRKAVVTPGDGNCLFHAVKAALDDLLKREKGKGTIDAVAVASAKACREEAVRTLLEPAKASLRAAHPECTTDYLGQMIHEARSAGDVARWGGDAEIAGLADGTLITLAGKRVPVRIKVLSEAYPEGFLDYEDGNPALTIELLHRNPYGNHWEWVAPK